MEQLNGENCYTSTEFAVKLAAQNDIGTDTAMSNLSNWQQRKTFKADGANSKGRLYLKRRIDSLFEFAQDNKIDHDLLNEFKKSNSDNAVTGSEATAQIKFVGVEDLKIDAEFKDLIPPLADEEFKQLEENIQRDGILTPLCIWQGVIVDGHNRYLIATRQGLNRVPVKELSFDTRADVTNWIIENQLGRRNLSIYDRGLLALKLKPVIAQKSKERQAEYSGNQYESGLSKKSYEVQNIEEQPKSARQGRTDFQVAKIAGISEDTLRKIEKIQATADAETIESIRRGDLSINKAYKKLSNQEKTVEPTADSKAQQIERLNKEIARLKKKLAEKCAARDSLMAQLTGDAAQIDSATVEASKLYAYGVTALNPTFKGVPSGYVKNENLGGVQQVEDTENYIFAIVYYSAPLTENQIMDYDLVDITDKVAEYLEHKQDAAIDSDLADPNPYAPLADEYNANDNYIAQV